MHPESDLLQKLRQDFPNITFVAGSAYVWSPQDNRIQYAKPISNYCLLHEIGHALAQHQSYKLDIQLLKMEAEAWERARIIAPKYNITIPQAYLTNCMNTYRDWLLARSTCPQCRLVGIQSNHNSRYQCINCHLYWKVPSASQCLVRRIQQPSNTV